MELALCPYMVFLWESDPSRIRFGRRATAYRSALKAYTNHGYESGSMVLTRLMASADRPQDEGLYRKTHDWYARFHAYVTERGLSFLKSGARPAVSVGPHTLSLDIRLVENREEHRLAAWVLFDFVETRLSADLYGLAISAIKWALKQANDRFEAVVFYVPQTGEIREEAISPTDANWDPQPLIALMNDLTGRPPHHKNPGPHCQECWHYRQKRCDGTTNLFVVEEPAD